MSNDAAGFYVPHLGVNTITQICPGDSVNIFTVGSENVTVNYPRVNPADTELDIDPPYNQDILPLYEYTTESSDGVNPNGNYQNEFITYKDNLICESERSRNPRWWEDDSYLNYTLPMKCRPIDRDLVHVNTFYRRPNTLIPQSPISRSGDNSNTNRSSNPISTTSQFDLDYSC